MCHRGWAGLSNRRMAIEVEVLILTRRGGVVSSGVVVRAGLGCVTWAIRNSADLSKPSWAD